MKLIIKNETEHLNTYFFQMLCLIYFHGEKFPEVQPEKVKRTASFSLKQEGSGFFVEVSVTDNGKEAFSSAYASTADMLGDKSENAAAALACGKAFLGACEKLFGFLPPWGLLTGIRPVKRTLACLNSGLTEEQTIKIFENDFLASEEKARLCVKAAKKQQKMLSGINKKDCSLYIAIPFCPTRCEYCSFVSYSGQKLFALIPEYVNKLISDIERTSKLVSATGLKLRSVYIGGGTPTILTPKQINRITACVNNCFDMSGVLEFTLEAGRPDTITKEKLEAAKSNGVDRVSINPQTLDENILKSIGRHHTAEQFFKAFEIARTVGFAVNTDLIAALPGDTAEGFQKTIEGILPLAPENVTVHTLSLKNAAMLREEGFVTDAGDDIAAKSAKIAAQMLGAEGYSPYYLYRQKNTVGNGENCGYSKDGFECLYNVLMMEDNSIVFGCGASAVTKIVYNGGIKRFGFPKYPYEYLSETFEKKGIFENEIKSLLCAESD